MVKILNNDAQAILHAPFNVETHKKTFINYLEVVILRDGTIEYAVPSHQLKAVDIIAKRRKLTRKQVADLCPPEHFLDYLFWLCREANVVMVWNKRYMGEMNVKQLRSLAMLMEEGLYKGNIDAVSLTQ